MAQKKRPQKGGDYQGKPKRGAEGRAKGAQGRGARSVAHQRMPQASRSQQTAAPQRRDVHAGYLTIKDWNMDTDSYLLDFPNDEVRSGFLTLVKAAKRR